MPANAGIHVFSIKKVKPEARMFFFEKKNQKTFAPWPPGGFIGADLNVKSFLRSFFSKKRPLS
jgi:hypothetical protein